MRPLTDHCPKPLLAVNGKPLIVYHIEALARAGIESIVINVSWLADQIIETLGDGRSFGVDIRYSHESEALETAGGIIHALDQLDEEFVVVNGDTFTDYDFSRLPQLTHQAHLVLVDNPQHNPKGDFAITDGLLSNHGSARLTFSGIAQYKKSFFSGLVEGKQALAPLLRALADKGQVTAEHFCGEWSDVGTPERLEQLQANRAYL